MSATFPITDRQLEEPLPVTVPQLKFKNDTQLVRRGKSPVHTENLPVYYLLARLGPAGWRIGSPFAG
jgi:hypothetical protein